jgi:hypothetical protein
MLTKTKSYKNWKEEDDIINSRLVKENLEIYKANLLGNLKFSDSVSRDLNNNTL